MMLKSDRLLLFGALAAAIFVAAVTILGALLPGYDPVAQTISEIGERGSPFASAFTAGLLVVALCLLLFAFGIGRHAASTGRSAAPALLIGCSGVAFAGAGIFAAPHPWHNLFGISLLLGYLAPLVLAVGWRGARNAHSIRVVSMAVGVVLLVGAALNFSPLFIDYAPDDFVRAHYGLIQRMVHLPFFAWCGYLSITLFAVGARA